MKLSLNSQILLGAVIGLAGGIFLNITGQANPLYAPVLYISDIFASIFVNLLKMILIPLVFASIVTGIANLQHHAQKSKIWKYALVYFLSTSFLSAVIGLTAANVFKPGVGLNIALFQDKISSFQGQKLGLGEFFKTLIDHLFMNPFAALAKGDILAVVIFSFLLGISLVVLQSRTKAILDVLNQFFEVIMLLVQWIIKLAPLGIMGLLLKLIATQDVGLFKQLGLFMIVVAGTKIFHGLIVLPSILFIFTRMNPLRFFCDMQDVLITAFSTSSSSATLPVTLRCVEEKLGVEKSIAKFVIPLGATVNMDGTALYEAAAALFVANLSGIHLNLLQQVVVVLLSVLASIGAPGIPSAGMVTMIMVLQAVGLPVEAIAILLPIDRPLDAIRTMINVEGDVVGSLVVQRLSISQKS